MRHLYCIILAASLFVSGCANSASEAHTQDDFAIHVNTSPDIIEIDSQLNALEIETQNLEDSYNGIQENILLHTDLGGDDLKVHENLEIFINDNNILIVNGKAISRNEFTNFVVKYIPALCEPSPKLSIHKKANYDTAAWVLEMLYSHGCTKVDIE